MNGLSLIYSGLVLVLCLVISKDSCFTMSQEGE